MSLRGRVTVGVMALMAAATGTACTAHPTVALPPAGASAQQVLTAYLEALQAGDCDTSHRLVTHTFVVGNGELCGAVDVKSYAMKPDGAQAASDEITFASQLVTGGSGDGSIRPGQLTWFYTLKKQPSGAWRITGGGSGP